MNSSGDFDRDCIKEQIEILLNTTKEIQVNFNFFVDKVNDHRRITRNMVSKNNPLALFNE